MTTPSERAEQAFNALSHSAQADGVIERSTAIWAVDEGRALLSELGAITAERDALAVEIECIRAVAWRI